MGGRGGGLLAHGGAHDARRPIWAAMAPHHGALQSRTKKGPEGLERRLGSELDLTVYQIYVSVDIHTPRSRNDSVERRANMCTIHRFHNVV